jgi:hypothetical protein
MEILRNPELSARSQHARALLRKNLTRGSIVTRIHFESGHRPQACRAGVSYGVSAKQEPLRDNGMPEYGV